MKIKNMLQLKKASAVICIFVMAMALCGCGKVELTREKYEKLSNTDSLSYKQAVKIIGAEGKLLKEDKQHNIKEYIWESESADIRIRFEDDVKTVLSATGGLK